MNAIHLAASAHRFNTKWGSLPDIAEFLIKPEGVNDRNWSGDSEGALVTYRGLAGGARACSMTHPASEL
jgi:hypothetical protein